MAITNEPRALSAALAGPVFHTRGGGNAMHAANRHVERWAPEEGASRVRPLRSLGFVDRLVSPWIETAQRSASLRLFSQYQRSGVGEREGGAVSWVFPRPWYQDELDWMAAARRQAQQSSSEDSAPAMFTTRGTYVAPTQTQRTVASPSVMPSALYEFVAPSLSIAAGPSTDIGGVGYGGSHDAYSPLVPLAAVQAAELMSRTVAPLVQTPSGQTTTVGRISPSLRNVLTTMLERAATSRPQTDAPMPRIAQMAPEMVTPPAPRPDAPARGDAFAASTIASEPSSDGYSASQLADRYAEQRARIVEVQRLAQQATQREVERVETARREAARAEVERTEAARTETRTPETRATEQRAERELRARATAAAIERAQAAAAEQTRATTAERAQQIATERAATEAQREVERARIEERVAQRITERAAQQRLHESARSTAAEHARGAIETPAPAPSATRVDEITETRAPAAMSAAAAAMAALPPELSAYIAQRPERAVQAIAELHEALRTAELIARSTASNATFEATRGPRLVMPAGIGGLVAAVDRAQTITERPAALAGARPLAPLAMAGAPSPTAASALTFVRTTGESRVPTLPWLVGPSSTAPRAAAPTTALGATAAAAPAALSHVAWADRWLARFSGATAQSLDVLAAGSSASPQARFAALASAAPDAVFVAPVFDTESVRTRARIANEELPYGVPNPTIASAPVAAAPVAAPAPQVVRYDDNDATPDDVFAQIAAAAAGSRVRPQAASPVSSSSPTMSATTAPSITTDDYVRPTIADALAHSAPSAPGAGLSAQLAASPFAPALRHVLPLPAVGSFDVRSLFGGGLSATYLAGLLEPAEQELVTSGFTAPAWARIADEMPAMDRERMTPEWDATYVAPELPRATEREAFGDVTGELGAIGGGELPASLVAQAAASAEPLTTLRTALLSWTQDLAQPGAAAATDPVVIATTQSAPFAMPAARALLDSMSLPLLGNAATTELERASSYAAPGMIAERAHGWSVAQERSASDLSLDFVTPELVLAARVYGLGPAEAAQAARLALAGPGQLTAMASTVDRTFVQALAIDAERREARGAGERGERGAFASPAASAPVSSPTTVTTAYPSATGDVTAYGAPSMAAPSSPAATAFGVDRRAPRGAFLWPSATVAALGLHAARPDGELSMSVAALELLAAQAVAEIGTYAALSDRIGAPGALERDDASSDDPVDAAMPAATTRPTTGAFVGGTAAPRAEVGAEPSEADVLASAAELVPSSRRARFEALYVALASSPSGRTWSPAARAARALALAGRQDEAPMSAYERAASAWDVLPVVYATEQQVSTGEAADLSMDLAYAANVTGGIGGRATRGARGAVDRTFVDPVITVDGRPGLGHLSARAGEALGSYVAPSASSVSSSATTSYASSSSSESMSPAMRAPSAAQELVRTGRPTGKYGGGETEIPSWFEAAARKMLEDRSGGVESDISLAELTLVTAAPASHVAASAIAAPRAAPTSPTMGSGTGPTKDGPQFDIEQIANDVYREILAMMDAARARTGEPYL